MPLRDEDVETTFERTIKTIKGRVFGELDKSEYFLSMKDVQRCINTPRLYPYADRFQTTKALSELVSEGKLVRVGGNFYTTPENFKKYKDKAK